MPRYIPLEIPVALASGEADLIGLDWSPGEVSADFGPADDGLQAIRVTFPQPCIVRLLDELALSTEPEWSEPTEGFVRNHLAYRVEGARFWDEQSGTFKLLYSGAKHYRLITGWTCMDVISAAEPAFSRVPFRLDAPPDEPPTP